MLEMIGDVIGAIPGSAAFVVVTIIVIAACSSRLSRLIVRRVIRRLAYRGLRQASSGLWRVRVGRIESESGELREFRRRQRIDAASRMVNHLVSLVIWIVATIVAFQLLDVNPAFFLSSAGFLGAALAIGGQHKVNDYLTGLSVHFEDRYGIGDEIVVAPGSEQSVHAIVDHIGLFSTRMRDEHSTVHLPNSALAHVRNLSQEAAVTTLRLQVPDASNPDAAASTLRGLAGTDGLTDVLFLGDLAARGPSTGEVEVDIRTSKALTHRSRSRLIRRAEAALEES